MSLLWLLFIFDGNVKSIEYDIKNQENNNVIMFLFDIKNDYVRKIKAGKYWITCLPNEKN